MRMFSTLVRTSPQTLAMPLLTLPGGALIGATVGELLQDPVKQCSAQLAIRDRFHTPALLSPMDLSAEAEEFGSAVRFSNDDVPTVTERLVTGDDDINRLPVPDVGGKRTAIYLRAVESLSRADTRYPTLATMIGPFSLAGRLFGVSEILLASVTDPETVEALLRKTTAFLIAYGTALKNAGAKGLLIAEPTAGLLSPGALVRCSAPFVKQIVEAVEDADFEVILHNCGARVVHLKPMLASGIGIIHCGKPMEIPAALSGLPDDIVLCGNLDPAEVFVQARPEDVSRRTAQLLDSIAGRRNFVISSGCDIPADAPMENITAFFDAIHHHS
jgi:uroporphyrinogen decarboxylase